MLAALAAAALAAASDVAAATPVDATLPVWEGLSWRWAPGQTRRWHVQVEVALPLYQWWVADRNRQARVLGWHLDLVLDCGVAEPLGRKGWELICRLEDVGVQAATLESERGRLQPILEEVDAKLTGAFLQVRLRKNGRLTNLDLEGVAADNLRVRQMADTLRLVLARAMAGFELQLPRNGKARQGEVWVQYRSALFSAPSSLGTSGTSETLQQAFAAAPDGRVVIHSRGEGMIAPDTGAQVGPSNFFETRIEAVAVFDPEDGSLTERNWTAVGWPTASSALSEGTAGATYGQRGSLRRLAPDEQVNVGVTVELGPPSGTPSPAIQEPPEAGHP